MMQKPAIPSALTHWTTLGTLQLINGVIIIPISFFLAMEEGIKVLLGATIELSGDFSPETSPSALMTTFTIAIIALVASLISLFIGLETIREKEWSLLGTLIVQGCLLGTESSKFFLYVKPNFIALVGSTVIVILCLLKLKTRADLNKQKNLPLDPPQDPVPSAKNEP